MNKKVLPVLLSSLITILSLGCAQEQDLLSPAFNNSNIISTLARNRNTEMTLATYNVQNFFGETTEPGKEPQKHKPEASVIALAQAIRLINADVIALEEAQSVATIRPFLDKYLPEMGYNITLIQANDKRGINVATD